MPWRKETVTSQRAEFILEAKSKECSFSEICRRFGISRTIGYKWIERFENEGLKGISDRSKRPHSANKQVPQEVVTTIVAYRQSHPSWGATKIRKVILREFKKVPSRRAIHRILQDCNLISTRRRHGRRDTNRKRVVLAACRCNHIWTVDFKGWWRTGDGQKVFPLTIRDEFSKMVLAIVMLPRATLDLVKQAFIECFVRYGMPEYIRSDNGTPFAFSQGLCGLSRLSGWWIKLGIIPNFIPPASPQYNGGHERMHRDMAKDIQCSPARNLYQQQLIADVWRNDFNFVRPHDSLNDKTPSQVYRKSKLKYKRAEAALEYPNHLFTRFVDQQGKFKFNGKKIFLSKAVGGENIALDFTHPDYVNIWYASVLLARSDVLFEQTIEEYNLITGILSDTSKAA